MLSFESTYGDCNFLLLGDFNSRVGERFDFVEDESLFDLDILPDDYLQDIHLQRKSQDKCVNEAGLSMLEFCKQTGVRIVNGRLCEDERAGKFTCVKPAGSSVVDLVLCRTPFFDCFNTFSVGDPNILSDHCCVQFSLKRCLLDSNIAFHDDSESTHKLDFKYVWDEDKKILFQNALSQESVKQSLSNIEANLSHAENASDIDRNLDDFYVIISSSCDHICKKTLFHSNTTSKTPNKNNQPWYDDECNVKRNLFYEKLNIYRNSQTFETRNEMTSARSEYKSTLRCKRTSFDNEQTKKLESLRFKNAKEYWKMLKSLSRPTTSSSLSTTHFQEYFKAINNPESMFFQPDEDVVAFNERYLNDELQIMFSELNICITEDEIRKACKSLKNGRAGGPDYVINEFFKYGTDEIISYLCTLFNTIFDTGYFPEKWAEGYIVPLYKKGDVNDVGNYRGITLLSTLGKLFTRVLNTRLNNWAEHYNVYVEAQAGFRENMSTIDNIFILHGVINHLLNDNKKLFAAFVDFRKAFDFVVRDILWYRLLKCGVRGQILNVIQSIFKNLKSKVKHNGNLSESFMCTLGVAQGESISPFLFSMYLNDIEETFLLHNYQGVDIGMLKLCLLLYADDVILFSESEEGLQDGLNILYDYCQRWKLTVNTEKTKVLIFRKSGRLRRNTTFTFNGKNIEIVSKFNYLGVTFSTRGSFMDTHNALAGQATKAIYKMKSYLCKYTDLSVSHTLDLFDKLIVPILNYGSQVWGFTHESKLERVHLQFCKGVLGVRRQTQNNFIYGELGRCTLQTLRYNNILRFWIKILQCPETKYVKYVYNMMLNDLHLHPNRLSWVNSVKSLLENLGLNHAWLNQGVGNTEAFLSLCKQRITDNFVNTWNAELTNSTRADSYRLFSNFGFKSYLSSISFKKYRQDLTRLRLSSHRLEIETGRWHKPQKTPRNQRKCTFCNTLEDEFHFLLECPLYDDLRQVFIKSYFWRRPNILKFTELLKLENTESLRKLAMYVHKGFIRRNEILYQNDTS